MSDTRNQLIRYVRHLTAREYPLYPGESMLPEDANRLLHEAHSFAFRKVCLLAEIDPEAEQFKGKVYASITRPHGGLYDSADVIAAACNLAPPLLRRLERERDTEHAEAKGDPVGKTRRDYLKTRADYDPFCADANVAIDGLLEIPKTEVRIDSFDGSVQW